MKMMVKKHSAFMELANDIISKEEYKDMEQYMQHGTTSTYLHCLATAYISFKMNRLFHLGCDERSLIRGALLHDYFLYDWHSSRPKKHTLNHPIIAYENANKIYELNYKEKDIITKHMFPLSRGIPKFRESYLVSFSDKFCAVNEFFMKFGRKKTAYKFIFH